MELYNRNAARQNKIHGMIYVYFDDLRKNTDSETISIQMPFLLFSSKFSPFFLKKGCRVSAAAIQVLQKK